MNTAGIPESSTRVRPTGISARRKGSFVRSLLVSLMLHALVLSLQFGDPGLGLPWLGVPGEERRANIPALQAILRAPAIAPIAESGLPARLVVSIVEPIAVTKEKTVMVDPSRVAPPPPAERVGATAELRAAPRKAASRDAQKEEPPAKVVEEPIPAAAPATGVAVLSTDQDSQWRTSIAPQPLDDENMVRDIEAAAVPLKAASQDAQKEDPPAEVAEEPIPAAAPATGVAALSTDQDSQRRTGIAPQSLDDEKMLRDIEAAAERAKEAAQERMRNEELARREEEKNTAEQLAAVRAHQAAMELRRSEELARREEETRKAELQAAASLREAALERRRIEDLARREEEKKHAEQAAVAKIREEALAKDLAARALASEQRESAGRIVGPAKDAAGAPGSSPGKPDGGQAVGSGMSAGSGADLARRALAQARGSMPFPLQATPDSARRRGSLRGRDPRDIQLVFYGEGWRQKIERIGSMNYPRLSRNRTYDALVVTVSINSDGTLAGVHIDKSSGYRELDEAVRRIVEMSAPFAAFPPDLKRSYDVVDITRTWSFQEEKPRISDQ